jgi:hypothetical protein
VPTQGARLTAFGDAEMIRELFMALLLLALLVPIVAWLDSKPRLSVQQIEASLAK